MKRSTEGEQEPEEGDDSRANAADPREAVHDKADRVAGETFEPVGASTGEFPAEKISARRGRRTLTTGRGAFLVGAGDRKSTRLNSSHVRISYAVFCLKKKTQNKKTHQEPTIN